MTNADHVYHSQEHNTNAACAFCAQILDHEPWCATRDPRVFYAYQIVLDPSKISLGDSLVLHSLGVVWGSSNK